MYLNLNLNSSDFLNSIYLFVKQKIHYKLQYSWTVHRQLAESSNELCIQISSTYLNSIGTGYTILQIGIILYIFSYQCKAIPDFNVYKMYISRLPNPSTSVLIIFGMWAIHRLLQIFMTIAY